MRSIVSIIVIILLGLIYIGFNSVTTIPPDEITEREREMVAGDCNTDEKIDRSLLQQSWFADFNFYQKCPE